MALDVRALVKGGMDLAFDLMPLSVPGAPNVQRTGYYRRVLGSSYDEETGAVTPDVLSVDLTFIVASYKESEVDGTVVQVGDQKVVVKGEKLAPAGITQAGKDDLVFENGDSVPWQVVDISIDPTGQAYVLQCRKMKSPTGGSGSSSGSGSGGSPGSGSSGGSSGTESGSGSTGEEEMQIPTGLISMWAGLIAAIPSGWALCDGTNGTPDLRDKFVVGGRQDDAGLVKTNLTGSLTSTGGSIAHAHGVTDPTHGHAYAEVLVAVGADVSVAAFDTGGPAESATGLTVNSQSAPQPYFALAYIMKT